MKFTKEMLLPRITRRRDTELEKFIISNINKELNQVEATGEHCDLIQMQYFFESAFDDNA